MSCSDNNVFLVLGSGPGIGRSTAILFAIKSHRKIALVSRNTDKLAQDKDAIEQAALKEGRSVLVKVWSTDVAEEKALRKTLAEVEQFGTIEVVFFNAARVAMSQALETTSNDLELDFKITTIALHTTALWAIPQLVKLAKANPQARPSLLVTGSFLYRDPIPQMYALNLTKASQRTMTLSLAKQFAQDGVHIGLVSVGGLVNETNKNLNPTHIASKVRDLYLETPENFTFDVEIVE